MNCKELDRFIDTAPLRLRPAHALEAARVHADTCPDCAARLVEAAALEQALGSLPTIAPTSSLADGVMERVHVARAHMEAPARSARQREPETRHLGVGTRETLAWAGAGGGAVALFGSYLANLDVADWLRSVLSPAVELQGVNAWMMDPGTGMLLTAAGALLLAIGVLSLPGSSVSKTSS